jgi:hypothetical protein
MAVQEIMQAITGNYTPSNAYSFEFRTKKGGFITEIFFVIPPEDYSVSEPWRGELVPTVGGGYHADFGNDFKTITVKGSSHFYFAASARTGNTYQGNYSDAINGFEEFIKLRFLVSRYRDYTLSKGSKLGRFTFPVALAQNASLASSMALVTKVRTYIGQRVGALTDQIEMYWHNYDDDDHFKVKIDSWETSRSKSDPFTVNWNISMRAMEIDTKRTGYVFSQGVTYIKKTTPDVIRSVSTFIGGLAPAASPTQVAITPPGGTVAVTTSGAFQSSSSSTISTVTTVTTGISLISSTGLPSQIAFYGTIPSLTSYLAELRANFVIASNAVLGGSTTASVAMGTIPQDIQSTIASIQSQIVQCVVPTANLTAYYAGTNALSLYADTDTMAFWSDLNLISMAFNDIIIALNVESSVPNQPISSSEISMVNQSGVMMTLDTDQFPNSAGTTSSVISQDYDWGYYTIRMGDTVPSIASQLFPDKDYTHMSTIMQINQISQNDINSGVSVGQVIRYPLQSMSAVGRSPENMVYEPEPKTYTSDAIQKYLYGTDILVQNKKLKITSDGNYAKVSGIDAVAQIFEQRMARREGGLNPMHPEDGLSPPNDHVNSPFPIRLERIFTDYEQKAMIDPRISSAVINRKTMKLRGTALYIDMTITLVNSETITKQIKVL